MSDNRPIPDTIEVPGEKWDEIVGMLRDLEWVGWGEMLGPFGGVMTACPVCRSTDVGVHNPDCRLAALVAALRDDTTPAPLAKKP